MARVTRSKKAEIAEDNTARALGFGTVPLSHTVSQIQPFADVAGNTMPEEAYTMEAEIQNLKGAYRMAIGTGKKGKKTKNNKTNGQQESEDTHNTEKNRALARADTQETSKEVNSTPSVKHVAEQPKPTKSATKASPIEAVEQTAQPAARTTRRQAKAKEAEEELRKSSRQPTKETEDALPPDYSSVVLLDESKDPRGNVRDHKAMMKDTADAEVPGNGDLFEANAIDLEDAKHCQVMQGSAELALGPVHVKTGDEDDSFVQQITCRSPAKPHSRNRDSLELSFRPPQSPEKSSPTTNIEQDANQADDSDSDSFLEKISSRSPAKPISRIEDSVEALDHMEEVEEALHEAAMAERMVSPEKKRQKRNEQSTKRPAPVVNKPNQEQTGIKQQPGKAGYGSMRVKPTAAKHTSIIKRATSMTFKPSYSSETSSVREEVNESVPPTKRPSIRRPTSLLPPKDPVKSAKPATRPTNFELPGEAIARRLKEQREARLAQRTDSSDDSFYSARQCSGPSVKSTKPLTKPAFELPGEALSRKKREAHEAKVKAQEEEERKRREFKAKPVRKNMISTIRDTVASRARQSKIGIEDIADGNLSVSKRGLNVGAHRPSIQELHSMANISAPRAPAPTAHLERKPSTKFHGPSMSGFAMQRTVSASDVQVQRQRAKEIYNRDQKLAEDIEKERREREAAAKRSREEAAERGRQASREWAAKQLAKRTAEGDKRMSVGFGSGGQLGLKI